MPTAIQLCTRSATAAVAFCLMSFAKPVIYQSAFSGTWTLNESKSEVGEYGTGGLPKKIVVAQDGKDVAITKTTNSRMNGETTYTEKLTADGKEVETVVSASTKRNSTLSWEADGKQFDIHFTTHLDMGGQTMEFTGVEKWSLSDDGKTLYVVFDVTAPQGSFTVKGAYDKN